MPSPRAILPVAVVAAWAVGSGAASAGTTGAVVPAIRCEPAAAASTADAARDAGLVFAPDRCGAPAEEPRGAWHAEIRPYDGSSPSAGIEPRGRHGFAYFGPVAAFAHVFRAFDAAAAHHLLPHLHRRRAVVAAPSPDSIPSF